MYYRVSESIALRSFRHLPHAYYVKGSPGVHELSSRDFLCMLLCDGATDLEPGDTLARLEKRGLISACEKGEAPSAWSSWRRYDNACVPMMNLMVTGRCNYNCPHCFNAADNAPLMTEWAFDDLVGLLDQARDCGIHSVMLTGGEPMLHPRFLDVVAEIHARGMHVDRINTNGYYISQDMLDSLRSLSCDPLMKISFDGLGCHDFMRGAAGAEARTLRAIELCLENGFEVSAQVQMNRVTAGTLDGTLAHLDGLGVGSARLIRTSESDRWLANASGATLSVDEYYAIALEVCRRYAAQDRAMQLNVWQFLTLFPHIRSYSLFPGRFGEGECRDGRARCPVTRRMVAVTSTGEAVPCMQMSGYFARRGITLGNVHEESLVSILEGDAYRSVACASVGALRELGGKCSTCRHFERCAGGCPALAAILPEGEYGGMHAFGADPSKCLFFEGGWELRIKETLAGWERV